MSVVESFDFGGNGGITVRVADLFCGAGGTSTGLARACKALGINFQLVAVNHWPLAIETHSTNHTYAIHYCTGLDDLDPRQVNREHFGDQGLDLLLASPECTHHSNARGGKPVNDQSRAGGLHVARWIEIFRPKQVVMENVPEWETWGPTRRMAKMIKGKRVVGDWPDPERKGELFQALLTMIRAMGYTVEYKKLVAADYGDPTTRKRLFVRCALGNKKPVWPTQTHAKVVPGQTALFDGLLPWVPARKIIDWSIQGQSIFDRKKPLADSTMNRIAAGLKKFGGKQFILPQQRFDNLEGRSLDQPLHTITAMGGRVTGFVDPALVKVDPVGLAEHQRVLGEALREDGFAEPFVMSAGGPEVGPRPVSQPMNTVLTRDHMAVVEPQVIKLRGSEPSHIESSAKSIDQPIGTVSASGTHHGIAEAFLVPHYGERPGQEPRTHSIDEPVPTIPATGGGKFEVVQASAVPVDSFLLSQASGGAPRSVEEPAPTIVTDGAISKVDSFVIPLNHGGADTRTHSLEEPMPTVTTIDAWALIEPFLVQFYGSGSGKTGHSVDKPLGTVTTKERYGLVRPVVEVNGQRYTLDIRFRMLTPKELARAMSFDDDYQFVGNREAQVKQIGNAVPCELAKALCMAALKPIVAGRVKKQATLLAVEQAHGQALA